MIDPIAVEIGPFQLHWYGIIIASAVLIAALLGARVARMLGESPDDGWSMLLLVVVLAVVGARIYHVIHQWDFYLVNPALIPQIWNGGIGIPGAVAGGALAIFLYTRSKGLTTARWLDIFAPALLLGQVIGRLGNFVNQELYGPPTDLPWGIPIEAANRVPPWNDLNAYPVESTVFHPLFAYEALLNLVGMVVLLLVIRRFGHRLFAGDLALMYIIWYGAVRAVLETFRTDNWVILGVPTAIWVGVIGFVLAGAWLLYRHRRGWGSPMIRPSQEPPPKGTGEATAEHRPGPEASPG
ncbi:MAG: prolipoprotein diacylglyceryl transferase [Candidatus Limnocylindria bacterium]